MGNIVQICNEALTLTGANLIHSIDEGTVEANYCLEFYNPARREVLSDWNWRFARKRVVLTRLDKEPVFEYKYAYSLPVDYLRFSYFYDNYRKREVTDIPFVIEGNIVLCNSDYFNMCYVADIEDASLFPPLVCTAISYKLAKTLALMLTTGGDARARAMEEMYVYSRAKAVVQDSQGCIPQKQDIDSWQKARLGTIYDGTPRDDNRKVGV